MTQNMNPQITSALTELTRLNEEKGLLLALHPDFILVLRPRMDKPKQESTADALLDSA